MWGGGGAVFGGKVFCVGQRNASCLEIFCNVLLINCFLKDLGS